MDASKASEILKWACLEKSDSELAQFGGGDSGGFVAFKPDLQGIDGPAFSLEAALHHFPI